MRTISHSALATFATVGMLATQASAQPLRESSYEMVTVQQDQNVAFGASTRRHHFVRDKVIILDKRSGELWAWSEVLQTTMYLGQIFPNVQTGSIAHMIKVNPDEKVR
jgi:hypothetical protein